jgi:M6 family metalloprotease-like protein
MLANLVLVSQNNPDSLFFFFLTYNTRHQREHYLKSSYGQLQIDSVVTNWVTIDYTEAYCSGGNRGLSSIIHTCLSNALSKVDPQLNFTQFDLDGNKWIDAIGFLHSGYGAEWGGNDAYNTYYTSRIWSHKWGLYTTWTSAEGVSVSSYHISPAVWGTSGSSIGRIGVIAHETGHL